MASQLRQHHTRLDAQMVPAVAIPPKSQVRVHPGEVEHMPSARNRARRQPRASPLDRDGCRWRVVGKPTELRPQLILGNGKRYGVRSAARTRLIAAVLGELFRHGFDPLHARLLSIL